MFSNYAALSSLHGCGFSIEMGTCNPHLHTCTLAQSPHGKLHTSVFDEMLRMFYVKMRLMLKKKKAYERIER